MGEGQQPFVVFYVNAISDSGAVDFGVPDGYSRQHAQLVIARNGLASLRVGDKHSAYILEDGGYLVYHYPEPNR